MQAAIISLTIEPPGITGGYTILAIVKVTACSPATSISNLAPTGNVGPTEVTLTSSNSALASVPPSVLIQCYLPNTENFEITTHEVSTPRTVTITAKVGSQSRSATLTLYPRPILASMTVDPAPVYIGLAARVAITLDYPAPPGGFPINVQSSDPINDPSWRNVASEVVDDSCTLPESPSSTHVLHVPAGRASCNFLAGTTLTWTPPNVTLIATAAPVVKQASFAVLPEAPNLIVRKIELTQAIQYLDDPNSSVHDNSLPLILNRPLIVRVYVNSLGTGQAFNHVKVRLAVRPSNSVHWIEQTQWIFEDTIVYPLISNEAERFNWSTNPASPPMNNVTFVVSPDILKLAPLDFLAEVNPLEVVNPLGVNPHHPRSYEVNYGDNTKLLLGVNFSQAKNLNVKFFRIDWWPKRPFSTRHKPGWNTIGNIVPYLKMAYPINNVFYRKGSTIGVYLPEMIIGAEDFTDMWAWNVVLDKLWNLDLFTDDDPNEMYYYALLHEKVKHNPVGVSYSWARVAAGHAGAHADTPAPTPSLDAAGATAAHEIAHTLGRSHAPCGNPPDVDPGWPDVTNPGAIIGHTGFDLIDLQPLKFDYYTDFMSFCPNRWVSPYTYCRLAEHFMDFSLCKLNEPASAQLSSSHVLLERPSGTTEYLIVRGVIGDKKSVLLPFYRKYFARDGDDARGSGAFAITLRASNGSVLFVRQFDVSDSHDGDGRGGFVQAVPISSDVASITLTRSADRRILSRRNVSKHAPTVKMIAPQGGETIKDSSGPLVVRWTASDPDGDRLSYMLLYSRDGGRKWEALQTDLQENSAELELADLPGSERAVFRVIASDGVRVAQADSGPFTVVRKKPEVTIDAPEESAALPNGMVVLRGTAYDAEDGSLPDESLTWTSDRDARLGAGTLLPRRLSEGVHVITLSARDSDGNVSTTRTRIQVGARKTQ